MEEKGKQLYFNDEISMNGRCDVERLTLDEEYAAVASLNRMVAASDLSADEVALLQRLIWNYEIFQHTVVTNNLIDSIPGKNKDS